MKIHYNSPVILSFSLIAIAVYVLDGLLMGELMPWFTLSGGFVSDNPLSYLQWVSYTLGHANMPHLWGNLSLLLLVGPVVEERYGSWPTLGLMFVTAVVTAVLHLMFFPYGLLGASGILFMFIILVSFTNMKDNRIPLTFILVVVFYIGKEVMQSFAATDNISQFAHIIGGVLGGIFGLVRGKTKPPKVAPAKSTRALW